MTRHPGSLSMIVAMLISGTIGWFVLAAGVPVMTVVFWRCVIGAATLGVVCAALGQFRREWLDRRVVLLSVLSGVAIVFNWVLLFAAFPRASIAISTAVYNVQPFLLVGLAALFLGERLIWVKLSWLAVAFAGVVAIATARQQAGATAPGSDYLGGIALALGASFLYAVTALLVKRLAGTPPQLVALIQLITGALLLSAWTPWQHAPMAPSGWASLVTLGMVHTGLMYLLLYGAIQKLPTAITGALSFVYPVAAIAVDWIAFGHRLAPVQWAGVAAILVAAAAMQRGWVPRWPGAASGQFKAFKPFKPFKR
ncbi:DMT family transporter [Mitsuaria sp. GD03876]|uniref:DMT family transporter n=1 Tax=Mitsuaria sp. GD03876 TaxID=2975399 RepID=UPI00244D185C|nr:DMT family transporter [Mitsuaria sp. GD03876]MDH0865535.1 DMT family transporter [Mitsuaria sp. GD03876]